MILPELEDVFSLYKTKGVPREYNRFINFSKQITSKYPDYQRHIKEVDEWFYEQKELTRIFGQSRAKGGAVCRTGLKIVDVYSIIKRQEFGLPKLNSTAARFSKCLKIWLAALWDVYYPILSQSYKYVTETETKIVVNFIPKEPHDIESPIERLSIANLLNYPIAV